jgi:Ca2+-binding EF-hand superfamily protein
MSDFDNNATLVAPLHCSSVDQFGGTDEMPLSRILFKKYDQDNSGVICEEEFHEMLQDHGIQLNGPLLDLAIEDFHGKAEDGRISYEEFIEWKKTSSFKDLSLDGEILRRRKAFLEFFQKVDKGTESVLDKVDFWELFEELMNTGLVDETESPAELFAEMDSNEDGVINFKEMVHWMERQFQKQGLL